MTRTRWTIFWILVAMWGAMSLPMPPVSWLVETITHPDTDCLTPWEIGRDIAVSTLLVVLVHGGVVLALYQGLKPVRARATT